jgi:prepilin-type N-terminal cleavage/methylation domain-containing protein
MTGARNSRGRAFTLVEMLVAMAVMGIVMSFAALEFRAVVFTYLNADSHLSAEQQARVVVAKVNDLSYQASVVNNLDPLVSPPPAIMQPVNTPGPTLQFTMAQCLDPSCLATPSGVPNPCYDVVSIFVAPDSSVPNGDPIVQPHNLLEQTIPFDPSRKECTAGEHSGLRLIARNVAGFTVGKAERCPPLSQNCTAYGQGYRIDISIFDYDDHNANSHAGALYQLSSVITPLTFGASK